MGVLSPTPLPGGRGVVVEDPSLSLWVVEVLDTGTEREVSDEGREIRGLCSSPEDLETFSCDRSGGRWSGPES